MYLFRPKSYRKHFWAEAKILNSEISDESSVDILDSSEVLASTGIAVIKARDYCAGSLCFESHL